MSETNTTPDWPALRALFPALRQRAYLNTASYGPGPVPVADDVRAAIDAWSEGTGSWLTWEKRAEESRGLFAGLIGCEERNVALTSSLSAAASQVAACLPAPASGGRDRIVCGADEFRSNHFPWHNHARRGFRVHEVPFRAGRLPAEDVAAAIDERTALVAVSHVQSANGYRIDIARVAEVCRAHGARLFVDGTQSVGGSHVPLEGVDFLAVHAYKWLLSPRGAAFLYVAEERLEEQFPLQPSWKTPDDPYTDYYGGPFAPSKTGPALDASLAWPVWQGTTRALELLHEVGLEAICARDLELAGRFRAGLPALGLEPLFPEAESSPIVALRVPDAKSVEAALAREQVVAAVRSGYLRTSFHFYNDEDDVDRALAALASCVR